jgi:hypothetical protein
MENILVDKIKSHYSYIYHGTDGEGNAYSCKRGSWNLLKLNYSDKRYYRISMYYDKRVLKYIFHRFVWECFNGPIPEGFIIDHKDLNKTNNIIDNLRLVTFNLNSGNRNIQINNSSGYKGVCWNKVKLKWQVNTSKNNKKIFLGYYDDIIEAALAYNKEAIKHGYPLNIIR